MDLLLSEDVAKHVLVLTKNDKRLARIMARELLASIDRKAMAAYLLTDDLALDLLAQRLAADLDTTLLDLQQLAVGRSPRARKARRVSVARTKAKPKERAGVIKVGRGKATRARRGKKGDR